MTTQDQSQYARKGPPPSQYPFWSQHNALIFTPQSSILGVFPHGSARVAPDMRDQFSLLLDSGCERTAIRVQDADQLLDYVEYPPGARPPFLPHDASGTTIPLKGEGRLSDSLPGTAYTMDVSMNLLSTGDFSEHWIIFPPKGTMPYGAYVVNPDGRVLVVATEGLMVYPHHNDQMISGIPPVILPRIQDRDASLWGPSGKDFVPDWKPSAASCGTYTLRAAAPHSSAAAIDTSDSRYFH